MMSAWSLYAVWQFIASTASVSTLIGAGAVAVAVLTPPALRVFIPDLRKWAIVVAVLAFAHTSVAGKFYNDGLAVKQYEWDAAERAHSKKVDDAVDRARNGNAADGVRDPYDRDDN